MKFENICLYETGKVAVSVRAISSDVRWCRILDEYLHVLREKNLAKILYYWSFRCEISFT